MMIVLDPPITMLPCVPPVLIVAAFLPFMKTVEESPEESALPQVHESPWRAAGEPSKKRQANLSRWGSFRALEQDSWRDRFYERLG